MSNLGIAAGSVNNLASQFRGLLAVAEALERVGVLENTIAETETRVAQARADEAAALADLTDKLAQVEQFNADQAAERKKTSDEVSAANRASLKVRAVADEHALRTADEAKQYADAVHDNARRDEIAHNDRMAALDVEYQQASAALAALKADVAALKEKFS